MFGEWVKTCEFCGYALLQASFYTSKKLSHDDGFLCRLLVCDGFFYRLLLLKLFLVWRGVMCMFGGRVKMCEFCAYAFLKCKSIPVKLSQNHLFTTILRY